MNNQFKMTFFSFFVLLCSFNAQAMKKKEPNPFSKDPQEREKYEEIIEAKRKKLEELDNYQLPVETASYDLAYAAKHEKGQGNLVFTSVSGGKSVIDKNKFRDVWSRLGYHFKRDPKTNKFTYEFTKTSHDIFKQRLDLLKKHNVAFDDYGQIIHTKKEVFSKMKSGEKKQFRDGLYNLHKQLVKEQKAIKRSQQLTAKRKKYQRSEINKILRQQKVYCQKMDRLFPKIFLRKRLALLESYGIEADEFGVMTLGGLKTVNKMTKEKIASLNSALKNIHTEMMVKKSRTDQANRQLQKELKKGSVRKASGRKVRFEDYAIKGVSIDTAETIPVEFGQKPKPAKISRQQEAKLEPEEQQKVLRRSERLKNK